MSNLELIDDYLTNRLSDQDREAFEQKMKSDPSLHADVELQTQIIDGLKKARAAELKSMLNNVPVSGSIIQSSPFRIAAGVVGAAVVVTAIYFYFSPNNTPASTPTHVEDSLNKTELTPVEQLPVEEPIQENQKAEAVAEDSKSALTVPKKENDIKPQDTTKPALDVVDPTEDMTQSTPTRETTVSSKPVMAVSRMEVEVDSSHKKYSFHYQFANGRMILYGSFDKSLYEILEINGDIHSVFLYYKENYYLLDEANTEITPLKIIKDKSLLQKLTEYRKK